MSVIENLKFFIELTLPAKTSDITGDFMSPLFFGQLPDFFYFHLADK